MAGRRREQGKPMLRDVRAERRRARLAKELGAATSPRQRVAAAVDYVKTTLGPAPSPRVVQALVKDLIETADQVWLASRHAGLDEQMAVAETGRDQLAAGLDYVRGALAVPAPAAAQKEAAVAIEQLVRRLVEAGERIQKRGGGR